MSFTPSMSPWEVARVDEKRGRGQGVDDPASDKDPSHEITRKGSEMSDFLDLLKSDDSEIGPEGEEFGKPLPAKKKREGESEFEHKIRQWSDEVEDRPKRFPGGKDQAVAIAAEQSGVSKGSGSAGDVDFSPEVEVNISPNEVESEGIDSMEKALNTRSLYIPRPVGEYDPFSIYRSATTVTNRNTSRLQPAPGVSPDVEETLENVGKKPDEAYKSCAAHGFIYKSSVGCRACVVSKSYMCQMCGKPLLKKVDGGKVCLACG